MVENDKIRTVFDDVPVNLRGFPTTYKIFRIRRTTYSRDEFNGYRTSRFHQLEEFIKICRGALPPKLDVNKRCTFTDWAAIKQTDALPLNPRLSYSA